MKFYDGTAKWNTITCKMYIKKGETYFMKWIIDSYYFYLKGQYGILAHHFFSLKINQVSNCLILSNLDYNCLVFASWFRDESKFWLKCEIVWNCLEWSKPNYFFTQQFFQSTNVNLGMIQREFFARTNGFLSSTFFFWIFLDVFLFGFLGIFLLFFWYFFGIFLEFFLEFFFTAVYWNILVAL